MEPFTDIADIERRLALVYAPAEARQALATLWRVDERLGDIVRRAGEPMIGAIRLAWWREAIEKLDKGAPPSEPLLQAVAADLLPRGLSGAAIAGIEQGWAVLLDAAPDDEALERHARERGARLFELSAQLLGAPLPHGGRAAGELWALLDCAINTHDRDLRDRALAYARSCPKPPDYWPRPLRPLGMLAALAVRDAARTDAVPERRGAPPRVARALWHRLSGR